MADETSIFGIMAGCYNKNVDHLGEKSGPGSAAVPAPTPVS